ncbi:hypothetical protein QE152_g41556 [Popillia japonica]|uniref:Uncharacterized protein n=1 Tax=Popillia japonica TaxID=7064 RepID=A0AAW1GCI5_POPJA
MSLMLGNMTKIGINITNGKLKAIKALHYIAWGNEGQPRRVRKAVGSFTGFGFDKNTEDYAKKIEDIIQNMELTDLVAVCHILDLNYSGMRRKLKI